MTLIAIVGIACRFPGAADAASFWRLLDAGADAITEVPRDRFDVDAFFDRDREAPGKMCTRWGGFLPDLDLFDAAFFGISPREAAVMDPQQRLMLELAFHGLEDAGLTASRIRGAAAGVFIGTMWNEFAGLALGDARGIAQHTASGADASIVAGRISYFLNLHGPSLTVNTGCSSSLVAVHLACESLRRGETSIAIAGGVNLMLSPETTVAMSKLGVLSPTGRCRAFDADADGYVRSDGGGVVILKPLADAIRDRDRIYATIAGSAINNDGATLGLTAPSAAGQARVLRDACVNAGISPDDLDYVEAHGTGTALGDRVEAEALGAAYGHARAGRSPLAIGSAKTNIGHAEGAAGVAGLIKTALCLHHRRMTGSLHFTTPNPHIDFPALGLEVVTHAREWPAVSGRPRRAGVSSFGFGGTNCHAIVEEWSRRPPKLHTKAEDRRVLGRSKDRPLLFLLSARSSEALDAQIGQLRRALDAKPDLDDLAFSLASTREPFEHRLAIAARTRTDLDESLQLAARGTSSTKVARGMVPTEAEPIAFLFTGQGSQYAGMGRDLYDRFPAFRTALDECARLLAPILPLPLLDVMFAVEDSATAQRLDSTEYAQPALFALEWALAELWRAAGVVPNAVLGHSLGEYVAACVAGVLSLEDALKLVAVRGRLMQASSVPGAMLSCEANADDVARAIAPWRDTIAIAAVNAPDQVVISGRRDAIDAASTALTARGISTTLLSASQGFHSPLMDPLLEALEAEAGRVALREPRVPLASNLTGQFATGDIATAAYWRRHAREPVQFEAGLQLLASRGIRTFVEIGPRPVLLGIGARMAEHGTRWLPSLRAGEDSRVWLSSLGALFVTGATVNWAGVMPAASYARLDLPLYPFQRTPHRRPAPPLRQLAFDQPGLVEAVTERTGVPADMVRKTLTALRELDRRAPEAASKPSRPATGLADRLRILAPDLRRAEIESEIRAQLAQVLGLTATSSLLDGRFRGLGLDSLMALQVRNALAAELSLRLPQALLFTHDTLEALSRYLADRWRDATPETMAVALAPGVDHDPYCLSPGQRRFWFLDRLSPDSGLYHVLSTTSLRGPLDRARLAHSFNEVLRRHDVLRTVFQDAGGRPRVKVLPAADVDLAFHDFSTFEQPLRAAARFAQDFAAQAFDLTREIPIRAAVLLLDASPGAVEHRLVVAWHHIATDGWSQSLFKRDLIACYQALADGSPLPPGPAFQHADAAAWEARWRTSTDCAAQRRFWTEKLRALPRVDLPVDRVPAAERTFRGGHVSFTWSAELTDHIKRLAAGEAATVFHVLLGGFAAVLYRASRQSDLGIGTIVANRATREAAGIIGPFVNTVVLRCDLSDNPSFSRLIAHVRAVTLEALEHARLAFDEIMRTHAGSRRGELNPLVRHCFALQNVVEAPVASPDGLTWTDVSPNPAGALEGTAKFDVNLVMAETDGRLGGIFEYSTDLFERASIERLAVEFESVVRAAVADSRRRIDESLTDSSASPTLPAIAGWPSRVPVPADTEAIVRGIWREALGHDDFGTDDDFFAVGGHSLLLLRVVNAVERAFGTRCRVADLFAYNTVAAIAREMTARANAPVNVEVSEPSPAMAPLDVEFERRATRTPHATALHDAVGRTITCEALVREAAAAATQLKTVGVGSGACVALNLPRSIEYIAFVLGALQCGAAVVPLPPGDPQARTDAITALARVRAIVRADGVHPVAPSIAPVSSGRDRSAGDAAFILSSSGTAGHPRLIVRSHRSFAHRLRWTHRSLPYAADDVCCLKSHMTTTHAVYELFEPLLGGAPCVIVPGRIARDLEAFWDRMRDAGVTRLLIVPSFLRASLESPRFTFPPALRVLTLMGEAVDAALAARILAALPNGVTAYSIYGTTEASSALVTDLRADLHDGRLPLGRPLDPAIGVDVLDAAGARVPPGGEGFLHLSGDLLFSGYLHDQAVTPDRFNTGDRVRVDAGGAIEFLGRGDRTVNVRGFRVDLDDVERALLRHEGVAAAVVHPTGGPAGSETLIAHVAPRTIDRGALLAHLRLTLPSYMLPGRLHLVDAAGLPRTASEKIDRRSLAAAGE